MFPCACSLRSTQCAALIALAAAAGIMRVESKPSENRSQGASSTLVEQVSIPIDFETASSNSRYEIRHDFAPWLRLVQLAAELTGLPPAPVVAPPTALTPRPRFAVSPAPRPSSAQHSFPFAVGPPERNLPSPVRADDTAVSRDSAARYMFASRIANLPSSNVARVSRHENRDLNWSVCVFHPGSALRGELAGFSSLRPFAQPMGSFRPRTAASIEFSA